MTNNDVTTIRLGENLLNWVKQKAEQEGDSVSDIIKEAVKLFKKMEDIPDDMRPTPALNAKGSKAAIMAYRLMEKLTFKLLDEPKETVVAAGDRSRKDIDECLNSTEK